MLAAWLRPTSLDQFKRENLHRRPYARPSAAQGAVPLFTWSVLDRLLAIDCKPDVLIIRRNQLLDLTRPHNLIELRAVMSEGIGLVIRRAEKYDADLAGLAHGFSRELPSEVHIQLFVTPGRTYGFGWHYDEEDVFIVQTAGAKDYFFRENTVVPPHAQCDAQAFALFANETSPLASTHLIAGDWLYIPSRWWHVAKCVEDSLSISMGVSFARRFRIPEQT